MFVFFHGFFQCLAPSRKKKNRDGAGTPAAAPAVPTQPAQPETLDGSWFYTGLVNQQSYGEMNWPGKP